MQTQNSENAPTEILDFFDVPELKSHADVLAYIARTRRQLDRFKALPESHAWSIAPDKAARIRAMCDDLEADIRGELAEN